MTVTVETLEIGKNGPRVFLVVRRVGKHLDIEQMPDEIKDERAGHQYAARRWKVPECDVKFTPIQLIELVEPD